MVIVRKATKADIENIKAVHYEAWKETYDDLKSNEDFNADNLDDYIQMSEECYENAYVAILKDKVIGFASFCMVDEKYLGNVGEITAIYILKKYQGMGIGRYLIQHCFHDLYYLKNIYVWTSANNIKSIEFYHHFGFVEDGAKKDLPLTHGEKLHLLRLRRKLSTYKLHRL